MASTTLRLSDYDFQRFQDGFDCNFDYRLVDYDFKKFPRAARPVPFIKVFITSCPFFSLSFPFFLPRDGLKINSEKTKHQPVMLGREKDFVCFYVEAQSGKIEKRET